MSELKAIRSGEIYNIIEYEDCYRTDDLYYPKSEVDAAIAELKAKLEDVQATAYTESVDAGMRERKLKRALWLARAHFCARSCEFFNGIMNHCLIGKEDLYNRCEKKKNKYLNAMYKCRAKAEEYR